MEDIELGAVLTRLDERTLRMDKALFGNGKQGLIADVVELRTELREVQRDMTKLVEDEIAAAKRENEATVAIAKAEVKAETPNPLTAKVTTIGTAIALIVGVVQFVVQALPRM